jgi:hypothetical protein
MMRLRWQMNHDRDFITRRESRPFDSRDQGERNHQPGLQAAFILRRRIPAAASSLSP